VLSILLKYYFYSAALTFLKEKLPEIYIKKKTLPPSAGRNINEFKAKQLANGGYGIW